MKKIIDHRELLTLTVTVDEHEERLDDHRDRISDLVASNEKMLSFFAVIEHNFETNGQKDKVRALENEIDGLENKIDDLKNQIKILKHNETG